MNYGQKIKKARKWAGLTLRQLAQKVSRTDGYLSLLENGHLKVKLNELEKIAEALGLTMSQILEEDYTPQEPASEEKRPAHPRLRPIPVLNHAQCGGWRDFTDLDYPPGIAQKYEFADTPDPNAFYVVATGDSMVGGRIEEGDLLLVSPNTPVESGDIVLAKSEEGVTVKKFFPKGEVIILQPLNPNYPPLIVRPNENFRVYKIKKIEIQL
jgi:repressor LexA